jgi:PAS domain S-box-containing protein
MPTTSNKPISLKLHKRIILTFILTTVFAILFVGSTLRYVLEKTTMDNWKKRQEFVTLEFAPQCDFEIQEAKRDLEFVSKMAVFSNLSHIDQIDPSIKGVPENVEVEKREIYRDLMALGERFSSLIILTPDANLYLVHPFKIQLKVKRPNFADRAYFKEAVRTKKPVISDSFVSAAGNPVVVIAVPVLNKAGDITAVIGGGVHLTDLSRLIDKKRIGTFDLGFIVDRKGRLIAHTNTDLLQKEIRDRYIEQALVSKFLDKSPQDDSEVMIEDCVDPVDGKHYLTSFVKLKSGWGLGLALSRETILSEIRPAVWRITILVSFIILLVGIIGVFFAQWIGRRWIGTEEALRESEDLHKEAQRVAHIGHWELYPEIGTPVWSDEIFRIFGLNPQEKEPSFTDHETHLHPDDWPLLNNAVTLASTEGTPFDIIFRIVRPDGEIRWTHAIGTTTKDEKDNVTKLFGTAQDITERKRTEEALRESEQKYRMFVETANEGIWAMDAEHRTTFANQRMSEILGYTTREMLGKPVEFFMYVEDRQDHDAKMGQRKKGLGNIYERRFRCKDGREVLTQVSATPILDSEGRFAGSHALFTDITERKRAEEALRESTELFKAVFEQAGGYCMILQPTDSGIPTILDANEATCKTHGYTREELIGRPVADLDDEEGRRLCRERTEIILSGKTLAIENNHVRKDGSGFPVAVYANVVRFENKPPLILTTEFDISDRKKAEANKQRLEAQLKQSQKMEAVGTLAGGIAHDFNNILAIILGNAELASDDIPDWNPASKSLKEIQLASIRAKDMVRQLLAFGRKSDEESKPLNMSPIVKESMKMLRFAVPTSVEFEQHISDDPCHILGDAAQINQIMMNVVTNAAQAMSEEGGLLEVTLEKIILQEEKPCFDWVLSPGPYVRLKVKDTGEGIAPEIMTRIFDPYYTTKEVGKGTGMGLSVIHGIVKRHNGGIRVESELGKGTVFEIYFPALEEMSAVEKEPEGEIKGGAERILFVDDEESMVNLNRQRLERLGYVVKSTTKPLEALEWFKAGPDQFDVIITDMTMPRMTGDRLAAEVLKIRPRMPVIICTGYSERMSEKKAAALGARKYIEKPIELRNLASALREVLDEK